MDGVKLSLFSLSTDSSRAGRVSYRCCLDTVFLLRYNAGISMTSSPSRIQTRVSTVEEVLTWNDSISPLSKRIDKVLEISFHFDFSL